MVDYTTPLEVLLLSRRTLLLGWFAPGELLIDTHVHLFASDQKRFPFHPNGTYKPPAEPVENYVQFVKEAGIRHSVIVHPEPYQDDHRYLEYCFSMEPSPGFFKGTCLFDPIAPETPARIREIVKKHPKRIVALRIHEMNPCAEPPARSGAIKNRDMHSTAMRETWSAARSLGLAIQMHFVPCHAPEIGELAETFPDVSVVLDHLGRPAQGTPQEWEGVLALAKLPRVYLKYSGVSYVKGDAKPLVKRAFDAFGPDRIVWGGLGMNIKQFREQEQLFQKMFDYASVADRAKIRGLNAATLYGFPL
jgi:L-fuconolactonase